jgi:AcrR family transcriptional regulator
MLPDLTATGRTFLPAKPRQVSAWKNAVLNRDEQFTLKRRALVREAARAFSARGYYNTSLDDVAKQLGVTKAALYYYVKGKEEILFECHEISSDLADQAMAFAETVEGTGFGRVMALARRYLELLTSEFGAFAVLTEIDALTPAYRKVITARRDRFDHQFRTYVAAGIADGSIRPIDPKLTVFYFMGAVNWMTRWFNPHGTFNSQQIAEQFTDFLAEAIRAR